MTEFSHTKHRLFFDFDVRLYYLEQSVVVFFVAYESINSVVLCFASCRTDSVVKYLVSEAIVPFYMYQKMKNCIFFLNPRPIPAMWSAAKESSLSVSFKTHFKLISA